LRTVAILLAFVLGAGCKKSKPTHADSDATPIAKQNPPHGGNPGGSGDGNVGIIPSGGGGGVVTNPGAIAGGGGGGGAAMAVLKATRRAQALNELKNLGELIEGMRDEFGKMPTKERILAELQRSAPKILEGIQKGAYVLTGTTEVGGLWAYEAGADHLAGIAVIGGRAVRSTPDELAPYFRKN
jgi:hypothetical protein